MVRFIKHLLNIINFIRSNTKLLIGAIVFLPILLLAILSISTPADYIYKYKYPKDLPPTPTSLDLILGTTTDGRPVFWILLNAIKNSLIIGIITALISAHIGLIVGLFIGMKGGIIDKIITFIADAFIVIPAFPLQAVLAMTLKDVMTIPLLAILLAIPDWPWPARQLRAIALSIREKDFIIMAQLSGRSIFKLVISDVMPHVLGWHLINFANTVLWAIGMETGLAIFGLSILSIDTLGTVVFWSLHYQAIYRGVWWWYTPVLMILVLIFVSLYLISVGIGEIINPRLRR